MKQYHIYGLGAALVDTEIEVSDEFLQQTNIEKGLMTLVDESRQQELMLQLKDHLPVSKRASGGSAANSIIACSYFGGKAFYSCKVADDENGHFYMNDLKAAGVESNLHQEKDSGITGKCLVMITPDAERTMNTFLGISGSLSVKELDEEAIANSEYVYIEGYLAPSHSGLEAAIKARELAQAADTKVAISLSDPGMVEFFKPQLKEIIGSKVDLIFCNEDEAKQWAETDDLDTAINSLKQASRQLAITLGSEGAVLWDGTKLHKIAAKPVKAIDTNGAGDMFAGAFLYAITHGYDFPQAGKLASISSAQVVSQFGPRLAAADHSSLLEQLQID